MTAKFFNAPVFKACFSCGAPPSEIAIHETPFTDSPSDFHIQCRLCRVRSPVFKEYVDGTPEEVQARLVNWWNLRPRQKTSPATLKIVNDISNTILDIRKALGGVKKYASQTESLDSAFLKTQEIIPMLRSEREVVPISKTTPNHITVSMMKDKDIQGPQQ